MADQDVNVSAPSPVSSGEETKTRKTVRLRPAAGTAASAIKLPGASAPISDPLVGRDTDTGSLELLSDTKTRRTVKLKPISPQVVQNQPIHLAQSDAASVAVTPAPAAPVSDGENTQTRRSVVLRPSVKKAAVPLTPAPAAEPVPVPTTAAPVAVPAPATPAPEGENTQTRRSVVLRPSVKKAAVPLTPVPAAEPVPTAVPVTTPAPIPVPAAEEAGSAENTNTRKTVSLRPPKADEPAAPAEDATVRLARPQRPVKPAPVTLAAPAAEPAPATPAASVSTKPAEEPSTPLEDATVRLARPAPRQTPPRPAMPVPALKKAVQEEPPAEEAPQEKAPQEEALTEEAPTGELADDTAATAENPAEETAAENEEEMAGDVYAEAVQPSKVYTVLTVAALFFLILGGTLCTIQYLNIWQNTAIKLPVPTMFQTK